MITTGYKLTFARMQTSVILGIGSNLGDRRENIANALNRLTIAGEIKIVSSIYETPPWGYESKNGFLNICLELHTEKSAEALFFDIEQIESDLGRERHGSGYADRVIDIDVIYFGNEILTGSALRVPHPQLIYRKFVLVPLREIAPNRLHPMLKKTSDELANLCLDSAKIIRVD